MLFSCKMLDTFTASRLKIHLIKHFKRGKKSFFVWSAHNSSSHQAMTFGKRCFVLRGHKQKLLGTTGFYVAHPNVLLGEKCPLIWYLSVLLKCTCFTWWKTSSLMQLFFPSGRRVFGQLYPEHLVGPVPAFQCHCCHHPVAALQCGGKAVQRRRPPLLHWLFAPSQEDPANHPTRNQCKFKRCGTWG